MLRGIKKGTLKDENDVCDRTDMYNFYNMNWYSQKWFDYIKRYLGNPDIDFAR